MATDWDAAHRTAPTVPRLELPSLAGIADADERFYITRYLNGARESDQDEARRRCAAWGIEYETARAELRDAEYLRSKRDASQQGKLLTGLEGNQPANT